MSTPEHIAIILDGNGRWAKSKGMAAMMAASLAACGGSKPAETTAAPAETTTTAAALFSFSGASAPGIISLTA